MQPTHLTKKAIEGLTFARAHPKAHDIRWDARLRGFGVRIFPTGAKTFIFRYVTAQGRRRLITVGKVGELTLDAARDRASRLRVAILDGGDPVADRREERRSMTLNALADRYLTEHAERKKKASSAKDDRRQLDNHIRPHLGATRLASITRRDIVALQTKMHATPFAANRAIALLSKMFNLAERWGLMPDGGNPCRHVERYPESRRERFLTPEELKRLGKVLCNLEATAAEDANIVLAVRLLVLTGCRLGEILSLRWSEVRLDRGELWLEDSKTGAKTVRLPIHAVDLLTSHAKERDNPFVIRGRKPKSHLINLEKPWRRIRKLAKLQDVRLHDLRHTYASVAAGEGMSLPMIGKLLGHRNTATTARYAHLANDAVKQAANITGLALAESFPLSLIDSSPSQDDSRLGEECGES